MAESCNVKGCPFPAVHWLKDINEVIPVCSQHLEFYHEEAGYFDAKIRLSLLSHSGSTSSLRAAIQDSLHPNIGFRMHMPNRRTARLNISSWAEKAALRRERERIADRVFAQRMDRREKRFARREERLLGAIERLERRKAVLRLREQLRQSWAVKQWLRISDPALGDLSQMSWEDSPQWQKDSALKGIELHWTSQMKGQHLPPSASHDSWLKEKLDTGWKYGPTKNPETKEHPCCVPYDELPAAQKTKDYLFGAVARTTF